MTIEEARQKIFEQHPLIHCISNIVTANDCANLALAVNSSPIMAQAPQEMTSVVALANALVVNTGTPSDEKFEACRNAMAAAKEKGIPIILDPVGVGASPWRLDHVSRILAETEPTIFRVNYSEACSLISANRKNASVSRSEHGVDTSAPADGLTPEEAATALARIYDCTVLLSGPDDIITDGTRTEIIMGGSDLTRQITGAGCMLSVLCAVFAAVENDSFEAVRLASRFWKDCAAVAEAEAAGRGLGSFHTELMNAATYLHTEDCVR